MKKHAELLCGIELWLALWNR